MGLGGVEIAVKVRVAGQGQGQELAVGSWDRGLRSRVRFGLRLGSKVLGSGVGIGFEFGFRGQDRELGYVVEFRVEVRSQVEDHMVGCQGQGQELCSLVRVEVGSYSGGRVQGLGLGSGSRVNVGSSIGADC
ncbi:hypothetical protein HAX54_038391 [Datura stramonium]|uniref:Uncharacterized protein n=1 Tax=Datura stramonium TaxID=4076 RepID=A0ABS8VKE1_DATST|nr:hypothetical protein [Datura stramonium]